MSRILVIDDNPVERRYLRANLVAWGHQVEEASDGAQGKSVLNDTSYDLVVCDHRMPGKAGVDLLRELRNEGNQTPFVLRSSEEGLELPNACKKYNAVFFEKRRDITELQKIIERLLSPR